MADVEGDAKVGAEDDVEVEAGAVDLAAVTEAEAHAEALAADVEDEMQAE
jgi:hypothetical protein